MIIFKGNLKAGNTPDLNFKVKIILIQAFPFQAPKVYIDQQLDQRIVKQKQYLGNNNEIIIPYLQTWNMSNNNLKDLMKFLNSVVQADPPKLSDVQAGIAYSQGGSNMD